MHSETTQSSVNGPRLDLLGIGAVARDVIWEVGSFPALESKVPVLGRRVRLGGVTANALQAAARLGARCGYAGVLGTDTRTESILKGLNRAGIDTRFVVRH